MAGRAAGWRGAVLAAAVAGAAPIGAAWAEAQALARTEAPSERLQVIYNPETRAVSRRMVRLYDPHPGMALDFTWEPAPGNWPGITPDGFADGPGKVSWRAPGVAGYDPRAVHHSYEGTLGAGRFEGPGVLRYRDGSRYEGTWVAGLLEGAGMHLDASGNRYEGPFAAGRAEGQGIWRSREGWVYTGGFAAGQRHGAGQVALPGGLRYDVVMDRGEEVHSTRPRVFADATLGGLLPAQSGGAAGKVAMAVVIDQRVTEEQSVRYTHHVGENGVMIFPMDEELQRIWNGEARPEDLYVLTDMSQMDWDATRAFAVLDLATEDGSRVRLKSLDLAVDLSMPHLRPVLEAQPHAGCVGFRPSFNFVNHGWGAVENAVARFRFSNPDSYDWERPAAERPGTDWYELPVGSFDQGADVMLRDLFVQAGADVAALETRRFTCPSQELMETCSAQALAGLDLGALNGHAGGMGVISTDLIGELRYEWVDAAGVRNQDLVPLGLHVNLATIEVPGGLAECGAGGAYATEAPQFLEVELPAEGRDYRINIPNRGNPNLAELRRGLKLWSRQSSMHRLHVEAEFGDGSIRRSPMVELYFLHPRTPEFTSTTTPASCYLSADYDDLC